MKMIKTIFWRKRFMRALTRYLIVVVLLPLCACVPSPVERLERIEKLLSNLEKEINITKTSPELADLHMYVNNYGREIERVSNLEYRDSNSYQQNSAVLAEINITLDDIRTNIPSVSVQELNDEMKGSFLRTTERFAEFVSFLKDRDTAITKGETMYRDSEVVMSKADAAIKQGKKEDAVIFLKEGKGYFVSGNSEFIKADALSNKLLQTRSAVAEAHKQFSVLVREKLGIELPEMGELKFIDKDEKRLERTVKALNNK